jgi:uncharacterized protein DUF4412
MRDGLKPILVAATLVAAFVTPQVHAGVEITQQTTVPDAKGSTKTAIHTTIIEGNHLKTITPDGTTIIDLDKGTMVALDDGTKTATEMSLRNLGGSLGQSFLGEFKPTGKKKTVGGFSCEEYTHDFTTTGSEVSSVSCIAKDVPGAAEASAFYRKMTEKMTGKKPSGSMPQGISVSDEATIKINALTIPGMPPEIAKKIAEAQAKQVPRTTKSEVTRIKSMNVAAAEFAVPAGYSVRKIDPSATGRLPAAKPAAAPRKK